MMTVVRKFKCVICGKNRPPSRHKYCSDECSYKGQLAAHVKWYKNLPGEKKQFLTKKYYENNKEKIRLKALDIRLKNRWGIGGRQSEKQMAMIERRLEILEQERRYLENLRVDDFYKRRGMCGSE